MPQTIVVKTPLRVSILGGGTDFPEYFRRFGGLCVGGGINLSTYVSLRILEPCHGHRFKICYSCVEEVDHIDNIQHRLVREILRAAGLTDTDKHIEIYYSSDLPSSSGMGTSSSFAVGLIHAILVYQKEFYSHGVMARRAVSVERNILQEKGGWQDQYFCAHPGPCRVDFLRENNGVVIEPKSIHPDILSQFCLIYTGVTRLSGETHTAGADHTKIENHKLSGMAREGLKALVEGDVVELGRLLDASWRIKATRLPGPATEHLCKIHSKARVYGAMGGKLLGAGNGGCFLFVVPSEKQPSVIAALKQDGCHHIPFHFSPEGSRVVHIGEE